MFSSIQCSPKRKIEQNTSLFSRGYMNDIQAHTLLLYKGHLMQAISYHSRMQTATNPCRQLNSEPIKGAASCYLSPIIHGKCSIISARCIANVKRLGLAKARKDVCHMRNNCDNAVSGKKCFGSLLTYTNTYSYLKENVTLFLGSTFHFDFIFIFFLGIKNVAFFFSAVATQENRKLKSHATKIKGRVDDEDSGGKQ